MALTTHPARGSSARRRRCDARQGDYAITTNLSLGRAVVIFAASALLTHGALADSAVGVDTMQGNALNPRGNDPTLERDSRGMSLLIPERSRTPSGLLYESPYEIRQAMPLAGNWRYRLSTEFGAIAPSQIGRASCRERVYVLV